LLIIFLKFCNSTHILLLGDVILAKRLLKFKARKNFGGNKMNQAAIGRFITQKRKEKNLTQEQLAEKIGVSNKTISKWECGKCMPDYCVVEILCKELDITLAELMNGKEDEKSIHTYDGQNVLEMLEETQRLKSKKILISGWIFIAMGIAELILSQVFGGTDFQIALSGLMFGISIPELLLGIFLICFSLAKR